MEVSTFFGHSLENSAKVISVLGNFVHTALFLGIIVFDINFTIKREFENCAMINGVSAFFLSINLCYMIIYYMLNKSRKTRNHLLVLPAMLHIGFLSLFPMFFMILTLLHIFIDGMAILLLISLLITVPLVYGFVSLYSLYMKFYNEQQQGSNTRVNGNDMQNVNPIAPPYSQSMPMYDPTVMNKF